MCFIFLLTKVAEIITLDCLQVLQENGTKGMKTVALRPPGMVGYVPYHLFECNTIPIHN